MIINLLRRKVPIVLQSTPVECGAAALAMICKYYRMDVSLEDAVDELKPGRGGTSAAHIKKVAQTFGLISDAYSVESDAIASFNLPAIIHWEFNHFVVLEKWNDKKTIVVDPAAGRKTLSKEDFNKGFTGIVLTFKRNREALRHEQKRT